MPVSGSASITDTVQNSYNEYDCDWFNATSVQPVTVTVTKFACPVSVIGATDDVTNMLQVCTPMAGVSLNLLGASNGYNNAIMTNQQGGATWDGVAAGKYSIEEQLPSGYATPVVICKIGTVSLPGPANVMDVAQGPVSIRFTAAGGQTVDCIWFNIPLPPPTPPPPPEPAPLLLSELPNAPPPLWPPNWLPIDWLPSDWRALCPGAV